MSWLIVSLSFEQKESVFKLQSRVIYGNINIHSFQAGSHAICILLDARNFLEQKTKSPESPALRVLCRRTPSRFQYEREMATGVYARSAKRLACTC